jgi:hypothetical protein
LVLELPVAVAFGLRTRRALGAVVLVNVLTNPLVNYLIVVTDRVTGWADGSTASIVVILVVAEAIIVVVEWRLLTWALREPSGRMFRLSLCMNLVSALVGAVFWVV